MKTYLTTLSLAAFMLLHFACTSPNQTGAAANDEPLNTVPDAHTSKNSLDWDGTYRATLPCADCAGIQTSIRLNQDQTYTLQTIYLGEEDNSFEKEGSFTWNSEGNTITLSNMEDGPNQYFVGENFLRQLDLQGNRISGELAENYILMKSNADETQTSSAVSITNTRWKLIELMGKAVDSTINEKEPFLLLNAEEQRVNANAGCNNIMGSYELQEGNRIRFSRMASTQMACPDMEVEDQFLKIFESVDNYTINEGQLSLNRARMAPLARFVAARGE